MEFYYPDCGGGGTGGENCCDQVDGKPSQLKFTFVGGGCSADNNSQGDRSECDGGVGTPSSATIRVVDKKGAELFDGSVALGDSFIFGDPSEKLESELLSTSMKMKKYLKCILHALDH